MYAKCIKCGSEKTHSSRVRPGERTAAMLFRRPIRCRECKERFWVQNPNAYFAAGSSAGHRRHADHNGLARYRTEHWRPTGPGGTRRPSLSSLPRLALAGPPRIWGNIRALPLLRPNR